MDCESQKNSEPRHPTRGFIDLRFPAESANAKNFQSRSKTHFSIVRRPDKLVPSKNRRDKIPPLPLTPDLAAEAA